MSDVDSFRGHFPTSFGKSKDLKLQEERKEKNLITTRRTEQDQDLFIPITNEMLMNDHKRAVTGLSVDPAGARVVSGSRDCQMKYWDFNGMDIYCKPFMGVEPKEGNPITDLQFSLTGDRVLVATASAHPKIYNRDGEELAEYCRGDMYLRDLKKTRGHTANVTSCGWHTVDKKKFMTSAVDGTIRIWDTENTNTQQEVIVIKTKKVGSRTGVTTACYSPDSRYIAGTGQDGAFWIYDMNSAIIRPFITVENAHSMGASSIAFSNNNQHIVSRGLDSTVKLWDIRQAKKPLAVVDNVLNDFEETNISYSPEEKYIVTGISVPPKSNENGKMLLLDPLTLETVKEISIGVGSVIKTIWHPKLNQILCGMGDGSIRVLFDPKHSFRGANMCVEKVPKVLKPDDVDMGDAIIFNPSALPMFRDPTALDYGVEFDYEDIEDYKKDYYGEDDNLNHALRTRKPEMPLSGPGRDGKIGTSLTHHILKSLIKDNSLNEDPREAILKHAEEAEKNPYFVAPAYKKTQPKTLLSDRVYENEREEKVEQLTKKQRK